MAGEPLIPAALREEVRARLIGILARMCPAVAGQIADDTPLADGGLCLDSLGIADLIAEIEATLGVAIPEADVTPERIGRVGLLVDDVTARLQDRIEAAR